MNDLLPYYRIKINDNLIKEPRFFEFLKQEFKRVLFDRIKKCNLDLTEKYAFTIMAVPPEWGNSVLSKVRALESISEEKRDPKWVKISEILLSLDPMNPVPVDVEFTLSDIVNYVIHNIKVYQVRVPGGIQTYFGIETGKWFDDYPLQTGIVLKAVDFGTLENKPKNLFNHTFEVLRRSLLDLFALYINQFKESYNSVVVNNVNI